MPRRKNVRIIIHEERFSATAQRTYDALRNFSADKGTELLAKYVARSISNYESGSVMKQGPLASAILYTNHESDTLTFAEIIAEQFIGKSPSGKPSYLLIDCSGLLMIARGTGNHRMLVGPPIPNEGSQFISPPVLSSWSLRQADFETRQGAKERALSAFQAQEVTPKQSAFAEELNQLISNGLLPQQAAMQIWKEISAKIGELGTREYRLLVEEGKPYRSVIVFDNLEFCPQDIVAEILRQILQPGKIEVILPGDLQEEVSFEHSIVLFVMHPVPPLPALEKAGKMLGFHTGGVKQADDNNHDIPNRDKVYRQVRETAITETRFAIIFAQTDELFLISSRTRSQQLRALSKLLDERKNQLRRNCDVHIEISDSFQQMLIEESWDPDLEQYTAKRAEKAFKKCFLGLLSNLINQGKLTRGSKIVLDAAQKNGTYRSSYRFTPGSGAPVTRDDMMKAETTASADDPSEQEFEFISRLRGAIDDTLNQQRARVQKLVSEKAASPK